MKITTISALITIALTLAAVSCINSAPPEDCTAWDTIEKSGIHFRVETMQIDSGWGYAVFVDEKRLILQRYIPVVEGFHHFETQCDALHCGKLVINKLINNEMPPAVTRQDLIDLNILKQ
ncbi:MAG: DUF4907 domain-containing protein [Bacteroidales bacterium]|nr:DUF4907 domain-containing protein [Bacteroidales bacterium]